MTDCHVFSFSIRTKTTMPLERMAKQLEEILGCPFKKGYHRKETVAWEADLLGMQIHLYEWRGAKNSRIFRLHGTPDNMKYSEALKDDDIDFLDLDISQGIIDLLRGNGGGTWYVPSEADVAAELDYGAAGSGGSNSSRKRGGTGRR
ncbi:hypothetical protein [Streptomyces sp. 8N706]|uniref:hypothetical protein n=1 Tax=Streptomyces sp. 8N706 TaxID=3457416 RepID=UPI003FCFC3CC